MHLHFDISPAWSTMERHDFIDQTENLFNDLKQILEFCGLKDKNISLYTEQFWTLWKIWKRRCINYYFMNPFEGSIKMNSLTLPSEPME